MQVVYFNRKWLSASVFHFQLWHEMNLGIGRGPRILLLDPSLPGNEGPHLSATFKRALEVGLSSRTTVTQSLFKCSL